MGRGVFPDNGVSGSESQRRTDGFHLDFLWKLLLSLGIGATGGTVFHALSLPLPWMLGAMCSVAVAALSGIPVVSARRLRPPLATIIGVTIGSTFNSAMFTQIVAWLPVTLALVLSTVMTGALGFAYLAFVARIDKVTAFFAGMPAGVYEMTVQGGLAGGDERRIALIQAIRIFLVVLCVPFAFNLVLHFGGTGGISLRTDTQSFSARDVLILLGCAAFGWGVGYRLGLPNAPMLGPMIASGAAHMFELTDIAPPYVLVSMAQVVLGTSIGGQFIGAHKKLLLNSLGHGLVLLPLMLGVCAMMAVVAGRFSGAGFAAVFLALSPGGMTEMSLVALAIHVDVTIVVIHQLLRIIMIHTMAPSAFRLMRVFLK